MVAAAGVGAAEGAGGLRAVGAGEGEGVGCMGAATV
jgi:hypothetical protein